MLDILDNIPKTDPIAIPEQRAIVDRILEKNRNLPGSVMVILNELQSTIGFVSPAMQGYVARQMHIPTGARRDFVLFILHH